MIVRCTSFGYAVHGRRLDLVVDGPVVQATAPMSSADSSRGIEEIT